MAAAEKFKKPTLGTPPDQGNGVIFADQVAPTASPAAGAAAPAAAPPAQSPKKKIDGRKLRVTGRTHPFSTRVSDTFKRDLYVLTSAMKRVGMGNVTFVEVLERGLELATAEFVAEQPSAYQEASAEVA